MGLREDLWHAEAGVGCEGEREFIWLEISTRQLTSSDRLVARYSRGGYLETHRKRISSSTQRRSARLPLYGAPGVDSSMKRPYSG